MNRNSLEIDGEQIETDLKSNISALHPCRIQHSHSATVQIETEMRRLIFVFNNEEKQSPMNTNVWRTLPFRKISVNWEMNVEGTEFEDIDVISQNRPSRLA